MTHKTRIPYFDFYPSDFMNGVRGLSAQEVGVYTMLLCRIYEQNGPIEYSILKLSTYCGMREKTFEKVIERLISLDKFQLETALLKNRRAQIEISSRSDKLKLNSKAGRASAKKRQQKQQTIPTDVEQTFNHTDTDTDTDIKDDEDSARGENTEREDILILMDHDKSGMTATGKMCGSQNDMLVYEKWKTDLGLSHSEICQQITETMKLKRDGPPVTFSYFNNPMQKLAGQKQLPTLKPILGETNEQFNGNQKTTRLAHDPALEQIARLAKLR